MYTTRLDELTLNFMCVHIYIYINMCVCMCVQAATGLVDKASRILHVSY